MFVPARLTEGLGQGSGHVEVKQVFLEWHEQGQQSLDTNWICCKAEGASEGDVCRLKKYVHNLEAVLSSVGIFRTSSPGGSNSSNPEKTALRR